MRMLRVEWAFVAAVALVAVAGPVAGTRPALALDGCSVGQKVVIPGGKVGTVTAIQGSACTVRQDDGVMGEAVWAAFMLKSLDGTDPHAAPPMTSIPPATYACHHTAGYAFVDVVVLGPDAYEDRDGVGGAYSIDATGRITFLTGTLAGHPSYARSGNVYLTAPGGDFYMTCNPSAATRYP